MRGMARRSLAWGFVFFGWLTGSVAMADSRQLKGEEITALLSGAEAYGFHFENKKKVQDGLR